MARNEALRVLPTAVGDRRHAVHEDGTWIAILRSAPSAQVAALAARGHGRTAVLFLQNACESRCFFCASPGVLTPAADTISRVADIDAWIADARGAALGTVCVAGTEPARHPHFEAALEALAGVGGPAIEVMTSGLALSEPGTARRWHERGVRSVAVPLYSADETSHDGVVGTDGAHARVLAGLDAANENGIEVFVHTLALRRTLEELPRLAAMTRDRWNARLAIGIARPKTDAWSWAEGAASHDELARAVHSLPVSLVGFPGCVAPETPRGAARVIDLYFRTTRTSFDAVCDGCGVRPSCPGALPEELARGARLVRQPPATEPSEPSETSDERT